MAWIDEYRKLNQWTADYSDSELVQYEAGRKGYDLADFTKAIGYDTPKSDMGKEFYAGGNRYLAGMGHVAGALGLDAGTEYARKKEARADLLQALSSAPHSWDEMQFGDKDKGFLPYLGQLAASSAPYMAETAAWAAGDALTGGALTPAVVARLGQAAARSKMATPLVEAAAKARSAAPELGWKAAMNAGEESLANAATRTAMMPLVTYPSSLGDVLSNQYDQAGTYNLPAAAGLAAPYAGLNALGLEGAIGRRALPMSDMIGGLKQRGLRTLAQGAATGVSEGFNEFGQEISNQYGRQSVDASYDPWGEQAQKQYKESFLGGMFLGGAPGAAGGAMSRYKPTITQDQQRDLLAQGVEVDYNNMLPAAQEQQELYQYDVARANLQRPIDTNSDYNLLAQEADRLARIRQAQELQGMGQMGAARAQMLESDYAALQDAAERARLIQQYGDLANDPQLASAYPASWTQQQVETMPRGYQQQLPLGLGLSYAPVNTIPTTQPTVHPGEAVAGTRFVGDQQPVQGAPGTLGSTAMFGERGGVSKEADTAHTTRRMMVQEQGRMSRTYGFTPSINAVPVISVAEEALRRQRIDQGTFEQVVNSAAKSPKRAAEVLRTAIQGANNAQPAVVAQESGQGTSNQPVGSAGNVQPAGSKPNGRGQSAGASVGRGRKAKPVGDAGNGQRVAPAPVEAAPAPAPAQPVRMAYNGQPFNDVAFEEATTALYNAQQAVKKAKKAADKADNSLATDDPKLIKARAKLQAAQQAEDAALEAASQLAPVPETKAEAPKQRPAKVTERNGNLYFSNESVAGSMSRIAEDDDVALDNEDLAGAVLINGIDRTSEGEKGRASDALSAATTWADKNGETLVVNPAASGDLKQDALESWYERNGFIARPDGLMVREPAGKETNAAKPEQVVAEAPKTPEPKAEPKPAPAPASTAVVATGNTARDIVNRHDISTDEGVMAALHDLMKDPNVPQKIAYAAEDAVIAIEDAEDATERREEVDTMGRKWLKTLAEHKTNTERKTRRQGAAVELPKAGSLADQLSSAANAAERENGVDAYSLAAASGSTLADTDVRDVVAAINARVKNTQVVAVDGFADLPADIQARARAQGIEESNFKGMITRDSKTLYVAKDTHGSLAEFEGTIAHELYGHFGMRALFGKDLYGSLAALFHQVGPTEVLRLAEKYGVDVAQYRDIFLKAAAKAPESVRSRAGGELALRQGLFMDEVLAHMAGETNGKFSAKAKAFIGKIKAWLRSHGFKALLGYSEADLLNILTKGRAALERGDSVNADTGIASFSASNLAAQTARAFNGPARIKWGENIADLLRRGGLATIPLDQLVRLFDKGTEKLKSFGDFLRDYQRNLNLKSAAARQYIESVRPYGEAWTKLGDKEGQKLTDALNAATLNEAWGDVDFSHEDNKHLHVKTDERMKETDPEGWARAVELLAENRAAWEEARKAYDAMNDEAKKLYRNVLNTGTEWLKKEYTLRGRAARDMYMPLLKDILSPEQYATLASLYTNDKISVTQARKDARELVKTNDAALEMVREMDAMIDDQVGRMRELQGPYFPLMRFGDFVTIYKSAEFERKLKEYTEADKAAKQFRADNFAAYDSAVREYAELRAAYNKKPTPAGKAAVEAAKESLKQLKESLKDARTELNAMRGDNAKLFKELGKMAQDDAHYIFEKHESSGGAKASAAQLKARFPDGSVTHMASAAYLSDALPTSRAFVNKLETRLEKKFGGTSAQYRAAVAALNTTFLETTHDRSSLKRMFLQRKKVPGYSRDGQRVFASFVMQGAHRLSSIEHFVPLQTALDDAASEAHRLDRGNSGRYTQVTNEILRRFELDMQYNETPVMNWIAKLNHVWTLGVSPAYLLQNLSQTFMVSAPVLAARFGFGKTNNAIWKAWGDSYKIIADAIAKQGGRYTIDIDKLNVPDAEKKMLRDLFHAGLADILMEHDVGEVASGNKTALKVNKVIDTVNWMSRQVELHNRLTTALAAFRLEQAKSSNNERASEYAQNVVSDTQINYSDENASRFLKKNSWFLAKLFGQFKKYQIGMATTIALNAAKAFKGDKEALNATLGMLTTHLIMTGTMGMSLYFPIKAVVTVLAGVLGLAGVGGGDGEPFDFDRWYKNWLADTFGEAGDVIARGLPSLVGLDFSQSLGQGNLFNPVPFYRRGNFQSVPESAWQAFAPPALGTASNIARGLGDFTEGKFVDGWIKTMPRWLSAVGRAEKLATQGITTKDGHVRVPSEHFDTADIVMQALGLPLLEVKKYYEREQDFNELKQAETKARTDLIKQWLEDGKRPEGVTGFNERHPDNRISMKDVVARRKQDLAYQRQVQPNGLRVGKRQQTIASEIRY